MDRFIASTGSGGEDNGGLFKIQYGQIYSACAVGAGGLPPAFKIQYGQIYRTKTNTRIMYATKFKIQYGQIYSKINFMKSD